MMKRRWLTALWVCCFIVLCHTENCPDGWVRFHESCYFFGDQIGLDFTEANHFCSSHRHSNLVVIESEQENGLLVDYAHRLFKPEVKSNAVFWLGASDEEIEGSWVWLTDHKLLSNGYSHWEPGQPDNGPANEDCLCIYPSKYNWHDCICTEMNHPLCEKNLTNAGETEVIG